MKAFKLLSTPVSWRHIWRTRKLVLDSKAWLAHQGLLGATGRDTGLVCCVWSVWQPPETAEPPLALHTHFGTHINQLNTSSYCLFISTSHRPSQSSIHVRTEGWDNDRGIFHMSSQLLEFKPLDENISGLIIALKEDSSSVTQTTGSD